MLVPWGVNAWKEYCYVKYCSQTKRVAKVIARGGSVGVIVFFLNDDFWNRDLWTKKEEHSFLYAWEEGRKVVRYIYPFGEMCFGIILCYVVKQRYV